MKNLITFVFMFLAISAMAQLPTIHPGTVTIGTVPEATATDSILTINENGLIGHIPKSEVETQLISVDDGNGAGWRLKGYDKDRFRPLGLGALDLTILDDATPAGNDYGVSANYGFAVGSDNKVGAGDHHIAIGVGSTVTGTYNNMSFGGGNNIGGFASNFGIGIYNTVTQGYGSGAIGSYNTVNQNVNGFGVAIGHNNSLTDIATNALGTALISKSRYTVAVGVANTDYAETGNNAARPIFVVGTGVTSTGSGAWNATTRRDGFIVRHNGHVEAPDLTTAKIDAGVPRSLVTKEWVEANAGGSIPTLEQVLEETDAQNSSAGFWPIEMRGGDLTMSTLSNVPLGGLLNMGYETRLDLRVEDTDHRTIISPNFFSLRNGNNVEARLSVDNAQTGPPNFIELTMSDSPGMLATREWAYNNINLDRVLTFDNKSDKAIILNEGRLLLGGLSEGYGYDFEKIGGDAFHFYSTEAAGFSLSLQNLSTDRTLYLPDNNGTIATEEWAATLVEEVAADRFNLKTSHTYVTSGYYVYNLANELDASLYLIDDPVEVYFDDTPPNNVTWIRYLTVAGDVGATLSFNFEEYDLFREIGTYNDDETHHTIFIKATNVNGVTNIIVKIN